MERRRQADPDGEPDLAEYDFPVGAIVGFHGLAGEVKIKPSTNNPELLADLSTVLIRFPRNLKRPPELLQVRACRVEKKTVVLAFDRYQDRTSVEPLVGSELFTRESELLPLEEEEFWVKDLVGLKAYTTTGDLVGTICSIIPGATDFLEITPENGPAGKTILIPFVKDIVPTVDMPARRIEINAIPGLLEPQ